MITTVVLANISTISHNYYFFFMVGTYNIYTLNDVKAYNTVKLTIITMLCVRSPELIHILTAS